MSTPRAVALPDEQRRELAASAASMMQHAPNWRGHSIAIGETFELWRVDVPAADISEDAFKRTGQYHHQVFVDGTPAAFAITMAGPNGGRTVTTVMPSATVAAIDRAITALDDALTCACDVRLLYFSYYLATALWATGDGVDAVYMVTCDPALRGAPLRTLLPRAELVAWLKQQS